MSKTSSNRAASSTLSVDLQPSKASLEIGYIYVNIHTYICIYIDIFFVNFTHFARSVEFIDEAVKRGHNHNFNLNKLFASLLTFPMNKLECWSFAFFSG